MYRKNLEILSLFKGGTFFVADRAIESFYGQLYSLSPVGWLGPVFAEPSGRPPAALIKKLDVGAAAG